MRTCLAFLFLLSCIGCSKNNNSRTTPQYRVSTAIHHLNGDTDTTHYTYNDRDIDVRQVYASNPSRVYFYRYTYEANGYRLTSFTGATQTQTGWFRINSNGYIDSSRTIRQNGTVNSTLLYYYDNEGKEIRNVADWGSYKNDYRKFYQDGNYSYWINDYINMSSPSLNQKDSIVFEFYADKPQKTFYKGHLADQYGKPVQNLVKRRLYYKLTDGNQLFQTWDYNYLTDAQGNVTREVWQVFTYPGAILSRSDTTFYTYESH